MDANTNNAAIMKSVGTKNAATNPQRARIRGMIAKDPNAPILDVLIPRDTAEPDNQEDLNAAKDELQRILNEEKTNSNNQSKPPSAGRTITGSLLDKLDEGSLTVATSSPGLKAVGSTFA